MYHGTSLVNAKQILTGGLDPHYTGAPRGVHICVTENLELARIFGEMTAWSQQDDIAVVLAMTLPNYRLMRRDTMYGAYTGPGYEWAGRAWRVKGQIPADQLTVVAVSKRDEGLKYRRIGMKLEELMTLFHKSI